VNDKIRPKPESTPQKMPRLHFSDELRVVKILEIEVPTPRWLAMIASAMPAITNPYSIAVAADRLAKKPESKSFKTITLPATTGRILRPSTTNPEPRT